MSYLGGAAPGALPVPRAADVAAPLPGPVPSAARPPEFERSGPPAATFLQGDRRMGESPTTQLSLLARIRDVRDAQAWGEFVDIYAPLVYRLARRHGLQDADAADLAQD